MVASIDFELRRDTGFPKGETFTVYKVSVLEHGYAIIDGPALTGRMIQLTDLRVLASRAEKASKALASYDPATIAKVRSEIQGELTEDEEDPDHWMRDRGMVRVRVGVWTNSPESYR